MVKSSVVVFYIVSFFLVQGEPVTIKNETQLFDSAKECQMVAQKITDTSYALLMDQPESYVTVLCVGRNFQEIGDL